MINKKLSDMASFLVGLIFMIIFSSFFVILMFLAGYRLLSVIVGLLFMGVPLTIIVGVATGWLTAIRTGSNSWRIGLTSKMKKELEQQKMAQLTPQKKVGIVEPMIERAVVPSVQLCPCCGAAIDASCKVCPDCHSALKSV